MTKDCGGGATEMARPCVQHVNDMKAIWKEPHGKRSLDFGSSRNSEDLDMSYMKKPKTKREPMPHRVIEKRRRDRMNNSLAELSRLIPTWHIKQGQGRIEKTEIIEMAIRHINSLTNIIDRHTALKSNFPDRYLGFKECQDEVMRYLVEIEGWDAHDKLCNRLMTHLEQAGEKFRIMNDEILTRAAKEAQYQRVDEDIATGRQLIPKVIEHGSDVVQPNPVYDVEFESPPSFNEAVQFLHQPVLPISSSPLHTELFSRLEAYASAQQITQEHLKHDKHLWTLLTNKYEDCSYAPYLRSNSSNKTDSGFKSSSNESEQGMHKASSDNNNSLNTDNRQYENVGSLYKFKHNISKRFSERKTPATNGFSSSQGSSESGQHRTKQEAIRRPKSPFSFMSSSIYSNSDMNGSSNNDSGSSGSNEELNVTKGFSEGGKIPPRNGSASSQESRDNAQHRIKQNVIRSPSSFLSSSIYSSSCINLYGNSSSGDSGSSEDPKSGAPLPGFVLHPKGTHYLPVSIYLPNVGEYFLNNATYEQNINCQTFSIPVNFASPTLYMKHVKESKSEMNNSPNSRSGPEERCNGDSP